MPPRKTKKETVPTAGTRENAEIIEILDDSFADLNDILSADDVWSTGSSLIDLATGVGGFPKGCIVEVRGLPSSGKSTMAGLAAGHAYAKEKMKTVYLDFEGTVKPEYLQQLGVDTEKGLVLARPKSLETGFKLAIKLIRERDDIALIVFDSVAAMVPEDANVTEKEGKKEAFNDSRNMVKAAKMSHYLPILRTALNVNNSQTTVIFINQIRLKPNMRTGQVEEVSPGGEALPFFATMRIKFKHVKKIYQKVIDEFTGKETEREVGRYVEAYVDKNKASGGLNRTQYIVRSGVGVDIAGSVFEIAVNRGVVPQGGARVTLTPRYTDRTEDWKPYKKEAIEYFRENRDKLKLLEDDVVAFMQATNDGNGEETVVEDTKPITPDATGIVELGD